MPIAQINTTWEPSELFTQSLVSLSNDTNWMVQSQTENVLILRRDPAFGLARWLVLFLYILFVVGTLGLGLLLIPLLGFLFIGRSAQQIAIHAQPASTGGIRATINYTSGARKAVRTIVDIVPTP